MVEGFWLRSVQSSSNRGLPWMELLQNSPQKRLYSWDWRFAIASKWFVCDGTNKQCTSSLRFLQEKFKNAK
jgi:hypothetical protein